MGSEENKNNTNSCFEFTHAFLTSYSDFLNLITWEHNIAHTTGLVIQMQITNSLNLNTT